jgi:hypothetical protein
MEGSEYNIFISHAEGFVIVHGIYRGSSVLDVLFDTRSLHVLWNTALCIRCIAL